MNCVRSFVPTLTKSTCSRISLNENKAEVEDLKSRYSEGKVGDVEFKEKRAGAVNSFLDPIRDRCAGVEAR